MIKAIFAKALKGDGRAFATILSSLQRFEGEVPETSEDLVIPEEDLELLRMFVGRQGTGGQGDGEG
jgi:hypothetical protein